MQVVSFSAQTRELELLWKSMNSILPKDIRVVNLQEVPNTFNARHRSAILHAIDRKLPALKPRSFCQELHTMYLEAYALTVTCHD